MPLVSAAPCCQHLSEGRRKCILQLVVFSLPHVLSTDVCFCLSQCSFASSDQPLRCTVKWVSNTFSHVLCKGYGIGLHLLKCYGTANGLRANRLIAGVAHELLNADMLISLSSCCAGRGLTCMMQSGGFLTKCSSLLLWLNHQILVVSMGRLAGKDHYYYYFLP